MLTKIKKIIILPSLLLLEVLFVVPLEASTARLRSRQGEQSGQISTALARQAVRLSKRLERSGMGFVTLPKLEAALLERRTLLSRSLEINILGSDSAGLMTSDVALNGFPLWIEAEITGGNLRFKLSKERIVEEISANFLSAVPKPIDAEIRSFAPGMPPRVETDTVAKEGYSYDPSVLAEGMIRELEGEESQAFFMIERRPGRIVNNTQYDLGPLVHLVTGRSNFQGSGNGRITNVRKGLHERIHNVVVPPGDTFSFNDAVGPMYARDGWQEALGIFNGNELRPVRGGGICQVATTVYRAAILYGFPIVERKNHSLYVSYYERHGVGIDATVFRGQQDLRFMNDTGSPLLVQAYTDGFEAYVSIYGAPDGRSVLLKGPFFTSNSSPDQLQGKALRSNEIGWVQEIAYADGRKKSTVILSRYKVIPQSLPQKFALADHALE